MNVNQWLWNATLSKSFLKNKLIGKLTAVDILNSVKNVTSRVDAQGRYEDFQTMIPRYAMISLIYKFDSKKR